MIAGSVSSPIYFNYKWAMRKKQIVLILLALEIILGTMFIVTKNLVSVIGQVCVLAVIIVLYKKGERHE